MKNLNHIKCPKCYHSFELTSAILNELRNSIETELQTEISKQHAELEKEKEQVQKLSFSLNAEKEKLNELIETKLKSKEIILRKQIEEQLNSEKIKELDLLEEQLLQKTQQLSDFNRMKREVNILKQQAEEKEAEIVLKYEEKLIEKLKEAKLSAKLESNEVHTLEISQNKRIISDLQNQLELARKKVESYTSGQFIGESKELLVEQLLIETFPQDNILEVPKGVRGADLIHEILSPSGAIISKILVEVKNVQNFSKSWIDKIKEDNRNVGAQSLVIITKSLPKELNGQKFGIIDDVFITSTYAKELMILLRYSSLKISQVMMTHKGRETKQELLFNFITSPDFQTIYSSTLSQLDALKASHDSEKKKLIKLWSEREKMLEIAIYSCVELYGNMRGICNQVPEIKSLELLSRAS